MAFVAGDIPPDLVGKHSSVRPAAQIIVSLQNEGRIMSGRELRDTERVLGAAHLVDGRS